jgi:2-dehydro-3-deoxyphosphogluconate aldolase / (4S)-4-hydroxy-2-oxoglutarate aldolase
MKVIDVEMVEPVVSAIRDAGVLPIVTIDDPDAAVAAAEALFRGGLRVVEFTFRVPQAAEAIRAVRAAVPQMTVGAGTLLTPLQVREAIAAGAQFGVSPGLDIDVLNEAKALALPFFPGVSTATEIGKALLDGCRTLKFFPAENLGGAAMVAAVFAPFAHLKPLIVATGSIKPDKVADYLRLPLVIATGASWVCPPEAIKSQNWEEVENLAHRATEIVRTCKG